MTTTKKPSDGQWSMLSAITDDSHPPKQYKTKSERINDIVDGCVDTGQWPTSNTKLDNGYYGHQFVQPKPPPSPQNGRMVIVW